MPDVFGGVLFLSAFLLAFAVDLRTMQRTFLAAIFMISVAAHSSLFPIAVLLVIAVISLKQVGRTSFLWPSTRSALAWLLIPLSLAACGGSPSNGVASGFFAHLLQLVVARRPGERLLHLADFPGMVLRQALQVLLGRLLRLIYLVTGVLAVFARRAATAASIRVGWCSRHEWSFPSILRATALRTSFSTPFRTMRIRRQAMRSGQVFRC